MSNSAQKQHWEVIYQTKDTTSEVSWYRDNPKTSLELISSTGVDKDGRIIDIGGGDSVLAEELNKKGFKGLFVLDISGASLRRARKKLGGRAELVGWIEKDVLKFKTDVKFDVWHDRATFHFLTRKQDTARYVKIADRTLRPGGYLIIATFSAVGPKRCSGLEVRRYSEDSIKEAFGEKFSHIKSFEEIHTTPFNTKQSFLWSIFKKPTCSY